MSALYTFSNVGKKFATASEDIEIIKNISLVVEEGEMLAIVGQSGSGKSTLFKLILGLYAPQEGSIRVFGCDGSTDVASMRKDDEVSSYVRPSIDAPTFRDADGQVIDYGNRWDASPPEDTYSVDTHPERFAPLHTVADALIAHLRDTYDVEVEEGVEALTVLHECLGVCVSRQRSPPSGPRSHPGWR